MTASITLTPDPTVAYLLRLGDTCLIMAQRLGEWCGHAPMLEEDIALSNMALDLLGQARGVLTLAGQLHGTLAGTAFDEDQLAFLREERDYRNATIAELPRGDFAFTVLRNVMVATLLKLTWQGLATSGNAELAAIAGKAVKEARYHQQHAADWVVRLGDGTADSHQRLQTALNHLWPYGNELFVDDAVDAHATHTGLGPASAALQADWLAEVTPVLQEATLALPASTAFCSTGKRGQHSEHMGLLLATMQSLQRSYPGGVW